MVDEDQGPGFGAELVEVVTGEQMSDEAFQDFLVAGVGMGLSRDAPS
ncbi:hypothetical protein [Salinispora pacifica]|nr:hypothetical protein [Salinispora pacifica]